MPSCAFGNGRLGRRSIFALAAAGALVAAAVPYPRRARAASKESQELLARLTQGKAKTGRITLRLPEIAEDGNGVPVTVAVDTPMSGTDRVNTVTIVADGNPSPTVATLHFGPLAGKAEAQLRIRLAQSQNVIVVAEMSDGSCWMATRAVKVTIAGCG